MKISPAVKVGILTVLSVIILIFSVMWLKGRSISVGERIEVKFHDVDGMRPGSAVQMMGIRIGQVEEIIPEIKDNLSSVKVKFVITEPGITIPQASVVSIQQSGIIGEKFLEITPPQIQTIYLPVLSGSRGFLEEGSPIEILIDNKYITVGIVKTSKVIDTDVIDEAIQQNINAPYAYKISYIINTPGISIPDNIKGKIKKNDNGYKLVLSPPDNEIIPSPVPDCKYTVIEPIRLKTFFDLQLKAALELEKTNEKINSILTDESISDLKATLKNAKVLTAKATITLDQATQLLGSSKKDFDNVVTLASTLSGKMIALSDNVNNLIGDPKLKDNLLSTTESLEKSTKQVADILSDPKLKETFDLVNSSTKDLSEITSSINSLTKEPSFKGKVDDTVTNLNVSLEKLSKTLDTVNNLTTEEKQRFKNIIQESSETSKNLKKFSDKLNGRFVLFKLLF